jgi:hypothetical protein
MLLIRKVEKFRDEKDKDKVSNTIYKELQQQTKAIEAQKDELDHNYKKLEI